MDNLNLRKFAGMEGRSLHTQPYISFCSKGKDTQCSHILGMECAKKVDVSEDLNMDCSNDYSNTDVSLSRAKMTNENVRLKKSVVKLTEQMSERDQDMPDVIDRKRAAKKVVPAAEVIEESTPPQTHALNYQPKQRPQKRGHVVNEQHSFKHWDLGRMLKDTETFLQKIKTDQAQEESFCLTYNPQLFSGIANLKLILGERRNSGAFGDVLKVRDTKSGQDLILKKVKKNAKREIVLEKNEIEVPLQFSDAVNITKFLGLDWDRGELSFVMENAGISLRHLVSSLKEGNLSTEKIEKIMLDVFKGLSLLVNHGITHCDIKPENICVNVDTWLAKLVDFGSSKTLQNKMTHADYFGVTPEYLDPVVNTYLVQLLVFKNKNCIPHQLDDKDDVFGAGLVGLFLIQRVHPMIYFFTGSSDYSGSSDQVFHQRVEVMKQICGFTEQMLSKLLATDMSENMKELLTGALSLDRQKRWTAREAVSFLQGKLTPDLQPPCKLYKQGIQLCQQPQADLSLFVDLKNKSSDKVVTPKMVPGSPEVYSSQESLGIAWKGQQPSCPQAGGILVPAKLERRQTVATFSTANVMATISPLLPQQQKEKLEPSQNLDEQDSKDHDDLVNFFNVIMTPQKARDSKVTQQSLCLPQVQPEKYLRQPSSSRGPQMLSQTADTGAAMFCSGPSHEMQQVLGGGFAVRGLTGSVVRVPGQFSIGAGTTCYNLPNIDLIESGDEQTRPKIRGTRRSRASQD